MYNDIFLIYSNYCYCYYC